MSITVLGYVCRDTNILPDGTTSSLPGGKGLFTSAAVAQTGVGTSLITWLPDEDLELLRSLEGYGLTTHVIPIPTGTVNTNAHQDGATTATTRLDPHVIEPDDFDVNMSLALEQSQVVHLAPDIQSKVSLATIKHLSDRLGLTISADIGKYFRQLQPDGRLSPTFPWPEQSQYLRHFDTVFLSEEDIEPSLKGGESLLSVARGLSEQGPNEVILTRGKHGTFIFSRETNDAFDIPAFPPRKYFDPTGAGDTFAGAYLAHRHMNNEVEAAGKFASMAASLKLNYSGPLRETTEQIEQALRERE